MFNYLFIILYFESYFKINITVETSESDTRVKLIDPKLKKSGWDESKIIREHTVTDGKIIDAQGNRNPDRFEDYVLLHGGMIVARVEAKDENKDPLIGLKQAKNYCKMLEVKFAYSSNGHKIEELDFTTNKQRTINEIPTPIELYDRLIE
jgi:type I restriction enzyme, R subunit